MSTARLLSLTALLLGLIAAWPGTTPILSSALGSDLGSDSGSDATASLLSATDIQVQHVFLVVLENHSYSSVIGNPSMPYLNSLAKTYAHAKSYYANTHPSIGNYFELTTGQIISNNDSYTQTVTADNIVRHLIFARKTWREYSEGLPYTGYIGGNSGEYTQHHNPLSYFSDVRYSTAQRQNLVPFTRFSTDLSNHTFPQYSFIVPDDDHNGHDCPDTIPSCTDNEKLAAADNWLQANLEPLILSSSFNATHGGLLVIVFDESFSSDTAYGGGHVAWVAVGPDVRKGYTSTTLYQHQSTLRFLSEAIGLTTFPGSAATAPDMEEFIAGD
ncbi:MAG TPA: alkaline phosphatase family protein [Acidisarcina sp.]|nr:alkaline phosphatase family protein [Acidisarcina sp.]